MTFEIEHKLPPLEVRLQKPEHHRTIYVMKPHLINYDAFPMERVPDLAILSVARRASRAKEHC